MSFIYVSAQFFSVYRRVTDFLNKGNIQQFNRQYQTKLGETKSDFTEIRNETGCLFSPYLFNIVLKVLARTKKITKGVQRDTNWERRSQTSTTCR